VAPGAPLAERTHACSYNRSSTATAIVTSFPRSGLRGGRMGTACQGPRSSGNWQSRSAGPNRSSWPFA